MTFVLDVNAVKQLANNPDVVAAFPLFKPYARTTSACCGKVNTGPDPRKAISAIFGMSKDRKDQFKQLLGADKVVGYVVVNLQTQRKEF